MKVKMEIHIQVEIQMTTTFLKSKNVQHTFQQLIDMHNQHLL